MITKETKQKLAKEFGGNEKNSGSTEVQIAILTDRIKYLTDHLKINKKDNHSRMGLLKMVGQRKKLLSYLKDKNESIYQDLIKKLGLRK